MTRTPSGSSTRPTAGWSSRSRTRSSETPGSRRTPPSRRSCRPGAPPGSYDPSRPLGAWLTTIAKRVAIDVYRRERRHRNLADIDTADSSSLITLPPSIDQMDDVAEVRRALDELPTTDRDLIRMQHFDELSHAEIARELEIPLGTVKSRTFRAHRRLAGLLAHLRAEPGESSPAAGRGGGSDG